MAADETTPTDPTSVDLLDERTRDGRAFVIGSGVFLVLLAAVLLLVSPRLQAQLGLTEVRPFPTPPSEQQVPLELDGEVRGVAVWDGAGVCAEVTDSQGTTFRSCATPDPLRPFWAIDAPDDAAEPFLLVATPNEVASIEGVTADGQTFGALVQARELPAGWALVELPEGAAVDRIVAFDTGGSDVGDAVCGGDGATGEGPDRLQSGCVVERQD